MPSAVVVGGGLAGIVSARELARAGFRVTLLESSKQLGGKAEAVEREPGWVEHGYHVFPAWYDNVRALLDELDIELVDFDRYHYLRKGEFPRFVTVLGPSSMRALLHNTFRGLLPWYHTALFGYSVIDMLSRSLRRAATLDRVSYIGLLRSAWYATESVATLNQENVLKASAIPAYEMSAMTAKKVASFWVKRADPFLSVLPGDLQTRFIQPLAESMRAAGVEVELETGAEGLLLEGGRAAGVRLADGGERRADAIVVTTPLEVTREFVDDAVYLGDRELGDIHHLEADPMAALHVYLDYRVEGLPREHVFLRGGRYGLSFLDVSQIWPDQEGTVLSCIASHFAPLKRVSKDTAKRELLNELCEYVALDRDRIRDMVLNRNVRFPLFINTVAAWPNRPGTRSEIPNLYFAGDWVKNEIDLACMEGAVSTALDAAADVLEDRGETGRRPASPATYPRALWVALRWGLLPAILPTFALAWTMERLGR